MLQRNGAMFSNLWAVVSLIALAEKEGRQPVVDFRTSAPANIRLRGGSGDGWTDYFEPISSERLSEIPASADISYIAGRTNIFPTEDYSLDSRYGDIFRRDVRLNDSTQNYVSVWLDILEQYGRVLGVHARGTDMKVAKSHRAPPEAHQFNRVIDQALELGDFDHIFVASEDERALERLVRRYGTRVITSDSFRIRTQKKVSQVVAPVMEWRYLVGLQVLRDAWLLGHCAGLVSGHSNVAEHAHVISGGRYGVNLKIRRPRVDVFGSHPLIIRATNAARWLTTSRAAGKDFQVINLSEPR